MQGCGTGKFDDGSGSGPDILSDYVPVLISISTPIPILIPLLLPIPIPIWYLHEKEIIKLLVKFF
jgi:hypothetical protein